MPFVTVGVVKYYPKDDYFIVGDNSSETASGITDTSYSGEITIDENVQGKQVKEISQYAFYQCYNLKRVTIHAKLTNINQRAFRYCENLEYINIPSTVTFIGWSGINLNKANGETSDVPMTIEFNEGRKEEIYIDRHGIDRRNKFTIIYPSDLEPLYNPYNQFVYTNSAIICAYKSFKFCNKFETTTDMSECPAPQYKSPINRYLSILHRNGLTVHVVFEMIMAMLGKN